MDTASNPRPRIYTNGVMKILYWDGPGWYETKSGWEDIQPGPPLPVMLTELIAPAGTDRLDLPPGGDIKYAAEAKDLD